MPLIPKPNYNQIFASQAPEQDKPAVFNNYPLGWGVESRPNNGKPTIKGFNYLQLTSDLKDLWILQNGACLPYDESIEYAEGAPVLKDGVIQYKTASGFKSRDSVTIPTYNSAADGVDPVTGVADGDYFNVHSTESDTNLVEYQNIGGAPTPTGKSYPSSKVIQDLRFGLESISDLTQVQNPANNIIVYVKSFHAGLYIGGDHFLFKLGSTLIPDGGRVFADPLDTGRWIRLNRDIKFEQFGAVGDGVHDDSDAIIATYSSPHTKRNGAFYTDVTCERATYRVTKTLGKCAGSLSGVGGGFRYAQLPTKFLVDTTEKITVFAADSQLVAENIWFTGKKTASSIKNDLFDRTQFYMCRFTNCAFQWFDTLFKIAGVYLNFDHCQFTENTLCLDIYNLADTTTSTMMQLMNCRFTYNTTGVQIVDKGGTAAQESFVNMLVVGTGFELGSNGIIADRQVYEMTLQNCWFEKLTNISVKASSSQVVEINTRWEADAAAPIKSAAWTVIKGTSASSFPEMSIGLLKGIFGGQQTIRVANNLELASKYLGGSSANVNENGYEFSQAFNNDQGSSVSGLRFNRRAAGGAGQYSGSDIVFYTGRMTSAGTSKVDRWRLDFDGSFKPIGDAVYNIGSSTERVNVSYVKTRMYSATVGDFAGAGSPEGVVTSGIGSTYRRTDGTAGACFYVKETGVGATGWVAK